MTFNQAEKIEALCPECGTKNEVLYFPSNKFMVEVPGSRAGTTKKFSGRNEKIEGQCSKCGYKFKLDDI